MAVRRAFKMAGTPPTGPAFLSFPWDSLDGEADVEIAPSSPGYDRVRPDSNALSRAALMLVGSDSPTLVVGNRVGQSGAVAEAVEVAELLGARVFAVTYGEVNFPTGHPLFMGALNMDSPAARERLSGTDVLLAVGANVFGSFIYRPEAYITPATQLIHMDSSAREIEKVYPTEIGMLADPRAGLKELAEALSAEISGSAREAAATRRASIAAQKAQAKAAHQERVKQRWDSRPISAERMMGELAQVIPSGAIVADESVTSRGALMGAIDFDEPGSYYGSQGGALGWAMPGSLGIQLAQPGRPVVAVTGDGASLYTVQALWTAARYKIPVTWVICNNRTYRILRDNMDIYLRDMLKDPQRRSDYIGMDFPLPLDLAGIAEGFGVHGRKVETPGELRPALEEAFGLGGPAVVDVVIDGSG